MATFQSSGLSLPNNVLDPWLGKVKYGSAVASLSGAEPMKFGQGQFMTFNIGEAEYVGEGANKGASTVTPTTKTVKPFKFHKTIRMTEEVLWADEDYQLNAVDQILADVQPSLSRALDFGVFHGINPTGGATVAAMTEFLSQTTKSVEEVDSAERYSLLDSADALVLAAGYVPSDAAIDPALASQFATNRTPASAGALKRYPDFRLSTQVSDLEGHRASVSNTVGAVGVAAAATNVLAFVGDFSAIRWGVQREIGLELIRYGDPDGGGDLKRNNQVAFRVEIVYGWGIADLNAFAKVIDAVAG